MKLEQVGDEAPLFMSVLGPVGVVDTPTAFYRLAVVQRKKNNELVSFYFGSSVALKAQPLARSPPPLLQGDKCTSL